MRSSREIYSRPTPGRGKLSASEREEELQDKLLLQAKAVSLLYGTEAELRAKMEEKFLNSNDESIRRFVKAMQVGNPTRTGRILIVALGELVMASLLVIAAGVILVPTVLGVSTYNGLVQYFTEVASTTLKGSPLSPYISLVEFVLGVLLMLTAFFALHEAALGLKEAGLTVKTGDT